MTKSNEIQKNNKPTKTSDGFVYPDGILVPMEKITSLIRWSRLSDVEKEALSLAAGKSYEEIQADFLHNKLVEEAEERKKKEKEFWERIRAEEAYKTKLGKELFENGFGIVLLDGKVVSDLPPFDDETFRHIYEYKNNFISPIQTVLVNPVIELMFTREKYPEYTVFIRDKLPKA